MPHEGYFVNRTQNLNFNLKLEYYDSKLEFSNTKLIKSNTRVELCYTSGRIVQIIDPHCIVSEHLLFISVTES